MSRSPRRLVSAFAALVVSAAVAAPVVAHAAPTTPTGPAGPAGPAEHHTLDSALGEVGLDRAGFERQSALADRLAAAAADYAARFPTAFAGVRIVGASGQVGVVRGDDDEDLLVADARSRGFRAFSAPSAARDLDRTADRVAEWSDSLPPAQRGAIAATEVDPASGEVTVVVDESAPAPPAELGIGLRRGGFRHAQSGSAAGGSAGDGVAAGGSLSAGSAGDGSAEAGSDPASTRLPGNALLGGARYRATDPASGQAAWCSLGFNGIRDGRVVNITAAHCSAFPSGTEPGESFRPGVISEDAEGPVLGRFTAGLADEKLDAALVTIDPEDEYRFRNSHVHAAGGAPLELAPGFQVPVPGQTVCKSGQRTGYTCGTVTSLDSGTAGGGAQVLLDLCVISGDSGGVVFSGRRAVAVVSMTNAWRRDHSPHRSCAEADSDLGSRGEVPQAIVVSLAAITERFPGLRVGAA